jgi:segregation and condensation protein A
MLAAPAYSIKLPVYQGPLDLLLDLIERAELDITRVALAQVTGQYLAYLRELPERSLADLASFLIIAARLLQIKSEALLPRPPAREPNEEDPGEALARQLIAYKKYKQIAYLLSEREASGLRTYLRVAAPPALAAALDLTGLKPEDLRRALLEALAPQQDGPPLSEVVSPPKVSIRDQIRLILTSMRSRGKTTFRRLLRKVHSRLEVVVTFLAMLELMKQNRVAVQQETLFGDIELLPSGTAADAAQEIDFDLEFDK